jgi:signal transduction histidine kinase
MRCVALALILGLVSAGLQIYGAFYRPDLRFRLVPYGNSLPEYLNTELGVIVDASDVQYADQRVIIAEKPSETYDPSSNTDIIEIECWTIDSVHPAKNAELSFEFPGHPLIPPIVRLNQAGQFSPYSALVAISAFATYEDMIRISTIILDAELNEVYTSHVEMPIPEEDRGSVVQEGPTSLVGTLNTCGEVEEYIAIGISFCEQPEPSISRESDSFMQSPYGMIISPADQPEWGNPCRIIPLTSAGILVYTKPYGMPCLLIKSGGSSNGWWTSPDAPRMKDVDDDMLYENNDDSWITYYLYDIKSGLMYDRLRVGEQHEEQKWPYAGVFASSGHVGGSSAGEIAILSWPCHETNFEGILYSNFTQSDTSTYEWSFEPDEPVPIEYGTPEQLISSFVPLQNSQQRLGFALIDKEGNAALCLQPEFYSPQKLCFKSGPPAPCLPESIFTDFLGFVPVQEGLDAYAFTTDDSDLVLFDEEGKVLYNSKIHNQFINDDLAYNTRRLLGILNSQIDAHNPVVVALTFSDTSRLCQLIPNPRYLPIWPWVLAVTWSALGIIWISGAVILLRKSREEFYLAPEDHEAAIFAEQESKERALDQAHEQRTIQARARLGQVADSLAHDLNTPLDATRKNLELIRDSLRLDIRSEVSAVLDDPDLVKSFMDLLTALVANPVYISMSDLNKRTDSLEEVLDEQFPLIASSADKFAKNGFDERSAKEFIEKFGEGRAKMLIKILDREVSLRRAVRQSLDQVAISLGIANRLKNLTSRKAFNIQLGIESALQILQGDLAARKIKVTQDYEDVPGLLGDPVSIIETMNIIIQNAIDVLPDSGEIRIKVASSGDFLEISIANNGPEIPEEILTEIWQRGFSSGKPGGQGLGLYIARDLIENLGGKISAESGAEWTKFKIQLPLSSQGQ